MKLLYRLLLMLCLLLPGMGAINPGHAAHRPVCAASLDAAAQHQEIAGMQARIQQLIIKAGDPCRECRVCEPRAAIAEDNDNEDDDRDERSAVSSELPVALSAFVFTAPVAAYCPESPARVPAHSRHFLCPTTGRRLALLRVFRL